MNLHIEHVSVRTRLSFLFLFLNNAPWNDTWSHIFSCLTLNRFHSSVVYLILSNMCDVLTWMYVLYYRYSEWTLTWTWVKGSQTLSVEDCTFLFSIRLLIGVKKKSWPTSVWSLIWTLWITQNLVVGDPLNCLSAWIFRHTWSVQWFVLSKLMHSSRHFHYSCTLRQECILVGM